MHAWLCAAALTAAGCIGAIDDPHGSASPGDGTGRDAGRDLSDGGTLAACRSAGEIGHAPLARLTRMQYGNAVTDLFAPVDVGRPGSSLVEDSALGGFRNNSAIPVSDLELRAYADEAALAAEVARANADVLTGCAMPDAADEEACVRSFVDGFVTRAYRRPVTEDETARLLELFHALRGAGETYAGAVSGLVETVLQSPHFLYRLELPGGEPGTVVPLDGYQVATRLAFFLWETIPDEALLAAAAAGELTSPEDVEAHARRMLDAPQAGRAIESFHLQWLGVDDVAAIDKDTEVYPVFDATLAQLMRRETALFADHVVREGDGRLETLLLGGFSFLRGDLYTLYGLPGGTAEWARVEMDPAVRPGLLTHASFLASHAHPDQTSPVHRGKTIRENLFCETLPAPPADVDDTPPDPDPSLTTRERFAAHNEVEACAGCHRMMDPIGLTFEGFDGVGQHRTMEAGRAVDTSGEIHGTDVPGAIDGVRELSERVLESRQARECLVRNWYRFAVGRLETSEDACSLGDAYARFEAADFDIRELLIGLAVSDSFRNYLVPEVE
jgi:hypothetical protein